MVQGTTFSVFDYHINCKYLSRSHERLMNYMLLWWMKTEVLLNFISHFGYLINIGDTAIWFLSDLNKWPQLLCLHHSLHKPFWTFIPFVLYCLFVYMSVCRSVTISAVGGWFLCWCDFRMKLHTSFVYVFFTPTPCTRCYMYMYIIHKSL